MCAFFCFFCKLLHAERKRVQTQCRSDFPRTCRQDQIMPHRFQFSKPTALGVTLTYFQDCWYDDTHCTLWYTWYTLSYIY